jgi:hypothetical protein
MSGRVIRLARGATQVGVVVVSIALGLCAAFLAVQAAMYHWRGWGPHNTHGETMDGLFLILYVLLFGLPALIAAVLLGLGAAAQLWPPADEGAN